MTIWDQLVFCIQTFGSGTPDEKDAKIRSIWEDGKFAEKSDKIFIYMGGDANINNEH